ncbi:MAG: hypothetical protein V1644_01890 [Candidatus Micrarchaeota archaeon]
MPLEWKQTTIGKTKITHWKRHNPAKLLEALARPPIAEVGEHPRVRRYAFEKLHLAVREFEYGDGRYNTAKDSFTILRKLARQRAAFVEAPVAFIDRKGQLPAIVTIWKKRTRKLSEFLKDESVSEILKERACITAARKIAMLHGNGFIHGHLRVDNFLVDKRTGNSHLVDYTLLREAPGLGEMEMAQAVDGIAAKCYLADIDKHWKLRSALVERMQKAYREQREKMQRKRESAKKEIR